MDQDTARGAATRTERPDARSVLVVGTGLVGTSVGLAAARAGWQVWLADADAGALEIAVRRGAGVAVRDEHAIAPELVVVAVPPSAAAEVIVACLRRYPKSTVSDVSSVKADVLAQVQTVGTDVARFVPGHPLAGSEVSGPNGGRSDLFQDRCWVLTPGPSTDPGALRLVEEFVVDLGAFTARWDAADHDRAVALTSHLPQLVSSALAAQLGAAPGTPAALAGQGFRDMTRIAASDARLWTQILSTNAGPVAHALSELHGQLGRLLDALRAIAAGDGAARPVEVLVDVLERGRAGRAMLPGKHGAGAAPTEALVVAVPDRPGELARLFAAAAEADVNLEDVRIDHVLGRLTGLVELDVARDRAGTLRDVLQAAGWRVSDG